MSNENKKSAVETYAKLADSLAQIAAHWLSAKAQGRALALAAEASPAELDRLDAEADARWQTRVADPLGATRPGTGPATTPEPQPQPDPQSQPLPQPRGIYNNERAELPQIGQYAYGDRVFASADCLSFWVISADEPGTGTPPGVPAGFKLHGRFNGEKLVLVSG